jgi:mannose-6-phosphate isomerase-like protein (cupin superfamily)
MQSYAINTDISIGDLRLIDLTAIAGAVTERWFNQSLCRVNDCVIRLGVVEGEFHWHKHDLEDEFFLVIEGRLFIDLEGETVELAPQQGFTVPRGVTHRTRAPQRTVMLMMEGSGVVPTGD